MGDFNYIKCRKFMEQGRRENIKFENKFKQKYALLRDDDFVIKYSAIVCVVEVLEDMRVIRAMDGKGSLLDRFEGVDEYLSLVFEGSWGALNVYDYICDAYGFKNRKKVEGEIDWSVEACRKARREGKIVRGN